MNVRRVCVYAASSRQVDGEYFEAARVLGRELAQSGVTIVYGGGSVGLMGALADSALAHNGRLVGVIPRFMMDLQWGNPRVQEMIVVEDLRERKLKLATDVDAAIALPGGSGTLDELTEVLTLKRLGQFVKPVILVNVRGFFDPLVALLERCIEERFMDERHRAMWTVVQRADEVVRAIGDSPEWGEDALGYAAL